MFQVTVWTFLRAGKLYITDMRGPYTNVSYFHYRSGLVFTRAHTTCAQAFPGTRAIPDLTASNWSRYKSSDVDTKQIWTQLEKGIDTPDSQTFVLLIFWTFMGLTDTGWLKAAKTTSLRRRNHCDVICHTTARRRSWQLSPDSDIGPSDPTLPGQSWGQYLVGTIPRSIRICVPNVVMIGPAVWPPILDRQTHTQNLYYII